MLCSFEENIFSQNNECDDGNTVCLPEEHSEVMGEKIPSKPIRSLAEAALRLPFLFVYIFAYNYRKTVLERK